MNCSKADSDGQGCGCEYHKEERMPKRGKKYQDSVKEFDKAELFDVDQAMEDVYKRQMRRWERNVNCCR